MEIITNKEVEKSAIRNFFIKHWGSPQIVISSGVFQCDELDGFIAINERGTIIGVCTRISLITTNDNLHALGFYQKRDYRLIEIFPNAVEKAREIKPEIPLVANNGIPIKDEILLRKNIN